MSTKRKLNFSSIAASKLIADFEPIADGELLNAGAFPVVINEVRASNSVFCNDYYKRNDWIELYNNTSAEQDISGMYITDNESDLHKFQITALGNVPTMIPAHGHLIVWCDKLAPLTELHTSFKLSNDDYDCVCLTAADDSWTDRLQYHSHIGSHSVCRFPDGGRCVYDMTKPTIGESSTYTSQSKLLYGANEDHEPGVVENIDNATIADMNDCQYYSVSGISLPAPQKVTNIIRLHDGRVKKAILK